MAGFASVSEDIRTAFNLALGASQSTVTLYWTNDPVDATPPESNEEYILADIHEAPSSVRPELNSRLAEVVGVVVARVFTQKGRGDKRNRQICDSVRDALQGLRHGVAEFQGSRRDPRGSVPNSRHFQANVITPFRFDSTPV